jgi:hypothetical protein
MELNDDDGFTAIASDQSKMEQQQSNGRPTRYPSVRLNPSAFIESW